MGCVGPGMARKFGPAGSTISLANKGGAVLRGIWVSSKGTSPSITVYNSSASVAAALVVPAIVASAAKWYEFGGLGMSTGLCVKVASCSGFINYQPPACV